jgi:hypothetical protein
MNTLLVLAIVVAIILIAVGARLPSNQKESRNVPEDHSRL